MYVHSTAPTAPTDPDAFLRWNEGREGKRELVKGKVVEMMTGATYAHARLVRRLRRILEDGLDPSRFEVVTNDIGVKTSSGVRYPDILVDRAGSEAGSLTAGAPVMIVEVLSPSSVTVDMVEKAVEYRSIASLQVYLVVAQHAPHVSLWTRSDSWNGPTVLDGIQKAIRITPLSLEIKLSDLYPDFQGR